MGTGKLFEQLQIVFEFAIIADKPHGAVRSIRCSSQAHAVINLTKNTTMMNGADGASSDNRSSWPNSHRKIILLYDNKSAKYGTKIRSKRGKGHVLG